MVDPSLVRRFLESDEQYPLSAPDALAQELDRERRLPDPRGPHDQVGAARDETALQHPVERWVTDRYAGIPQTGGRVLFDHRET